MTLSGLVELLILTGAGFAYIKQSQQQEMGQKALGVAQFLAQSPAVIRMVETRAPDTLTDKIQQLTQAIGATFIVIGDKEGIRLIHPVAERIGLPMKGGDNLKALSHGQSYVSYAEGSLGKSVRGKTPVFDSHGNIIGVVSVGYLLEGLQDRIEPYLAFLLAMALLVVFANGVLSHYASKRFQKVILGFEPEEIARLYVELDITMSTIKEGVLSIDSHGLVRSINKSACEILQVKRDAVINQPMRQVLPDSDLMEILTTKESQHDIDIYLNRQRIVANRYPIIVEGDVVGAVSSFRRRDEITELTKQLSQSREYADMLRSQTHEHRNKLNTISGLVQLGEIEAVQSLIGQETEHYQSLIEFIREVVSDPLVAGLLLGKTERARELGLVLTIDEGSRLLALPFGLSADNIVTIVGNLIDNAFDATLSNEQRVTNEVMVSISDFGTEVVLEVEDNGCGLPKDITTDTLTHKGVSSKKGHGRGMGLYLIQKLVDQHQGHLELIDNPHNGARITVYLPKDRLSSGEDINE